MSYCFMRIEKIKTETSFQNKYAHNFRTMNVPNANPDLAGLNRELIPLPEGETYSSLYKKRVSESPGYAHTKPRRDAVRGIEVLLTYNASTVDASFNKAQWEEENVKWLQKTFGKDNVISAMLHEDEAGSPHIHAIVLPFNKEGRLSAKQYIGGRKAMMDLQTSYGKAMSVVGLERGLQFSKAEHVDINRYYAALNKVVSKTLPEPLEGETVREYRDRANNIYVDANLTHFGEINKMQRKLDEARTLDMTGRIELEELRRTARQYKIGAKRAQDLTDILNALKRGYFPTPEENEAFKETLKEMTKWERAQEELEKGHTR